ncbi:MAG: hypothetical protein K0S04_3839 [Herbinix sp.]|jgi:hypothetical protein|nr:hypothetical protein [Herbinix sp.]
MDFTAITFVTILTAIGVLALIVSVITEVTKGVTILQKIPTNLQVIVLSLLLTLVTYFAYISYSDTAIVWYYIVADIIAGFIVAYVALYGWGKLAGLYRKFRNIPTLDITTNSTTFAKSVTPDNATKTSTENKSTNIIPETLVPAPSEATAAKDSKNDIKATVLPVIETLVTDTRSVATETKSLSSGILIKDNSPTATLTEDGSETDRTAIDISVSDSSSADRLTTDSSSSGTLLTDTLLTDTLLTDTLDTDIISNLSTPSTPTNATLLDESPKDNRQSEN